LIFILIWIASTVVLYISVNGEIRQLPVTVGKALNNGAWHLIKVQYGSNELRFTVDLNHNYLAWGAGDKVGHYKGQLHVGGYPK
jgi:Laminin G domain